MHTPPPGTGYFTGPTDSPGPGVLFLHSAWGLNSEAKAICDRLAELGYTVLAPDVMDGVLPANEDEAWSALAEVDTNVAASLIQSSARLLQNVSADPSAPLGVIGFSAGASWAMWLAARMTDQFSAVVGYYGTQSIDMTEATASFLCHFAETDEVVSDFEVADLGLRLQQGSCEFRFESHDGVGHGFAEAGTPGFNAKAEAVAWRQTIEFLATHLF